MTDYAITHNLTPFICMQNQYSLLYREEEREMMPVLKVCRVVFTLLLASQNSLPCLVTALWRRLYAVVSSGSRDTRTPPGGNDRARHRRPVRLQPQPLTL